MFGAFRENSLQAAQSLGQRTYESSYFANNNDKRRTQEVKKCMIKVHKDVISNWNRVAFDNSNVDHEIL